MEGSTPGKHVISAVGGIPFEGVNRWIVGYKAGAKKADPAVDVKVGYSRRTSPTLPSAGGSPCTQIAEGSGVVFNVAGACGLGTLGAAKDEGVWGVGVDVDQSYLGSHILTSAVMKLDRGVFTVVKQLVEGRLATAPTFFGLRNDGVGLARISPKVDRSLRRVEIVRKAIIAGKIRVPPPTLSPLALACRPRRRPHQRRRRSDGGRPGRASSRGWSPGRFARGSRRVGPTVQKRPRRSPGRTGTGRR